MYRDWLRYEGRNLIRSRYLLLDQNTEKVSYEEVISRIKVEIIKSNERIRCSLRSDCSVKVSSMNYMSQRALSWGVFESCSAACSRSWRQREELAQSPEQRCVAPWERELRETISPHHTRRERSSISKERGEHTEDHESAHESMLSSTRVPPTLTPYIYKVCWIKYILASRVVYHTRTIDTHTGKKCFPTDIGGCQDMEMSLERGEEGDMYIDIRDNEYMYTHKLRTLREQRLKDTTQ